MALDNSVVHMCLFLVVDQITLQLFNQMEWMFVYYQSSALSYGMWVSAEQSLLAGFFFLPPDAWI